MTSLGKRKLAVYVLVIFLAGAGSGALVAWHVSRRMPVPPLTPAEIGARLRARFQARLDLTPEQRQKVDPMIDQAMSRVEAIRQQTASNVFAANVDRLNEQVLSVLTPEQQTNEELERERRDHLRQKFGPASHTP